MKSQTYSSYKAASRIRPVQDTFLEFTQEVPRHNTLTEQAALLNEEASKLDAVLFHTLPGGLYDRLFAQMAARTASVFVVSKSEAQGAKT